MKVKSIILYKHRHNINIVSPVNNDFTCGIRIEADSDIPEDEVWFIDEDKIQKIKIGKTDRRSE